MRLKSSKKSKKSALCQVRSVGWARFPPSEVRAMVRQENSVSVELIASTIENAGKEVNPGSSGRGSGCDPGCRRRSRSASYVAGASTLFPASRHGTHQDDLGSRSLSRLVRSANQTARKWFYPTNVFLSCHNMPRECQNRDLLSAGLGQVGIDKTEIATRFQQSVQFFS